MPTILLDRLDAIDSESGLSEEERERRKSEERQYYTGALVSWELDAEEHILQEKGAYIAKLSAPDLSDVIDPSLLSEERYAEMIAEVEAAVSATTELDLALWDTEMERVHGGLETAFESGLVSALGGARARGATLSDAERAAFESELSRIESEIRAEFEFRDSFYIRRARNRYPASSKCSPGSSPACSRSARTIMRIFAKRCRSCA